MKIAPLAEVKTHFSSYVKASEDGPVVVTRNGKPVAVLISISDEDDLERLMMAHSPRLQAILQAAKARIEAGKGIPHDRFWQEVESERDVAGRRRRKKKPA